MYELPDELSNDLRFRILVNWETSRKIPETHGFDGEYPGVHPKAKF